EKTGVVVAEMADVRVERAAGEVGAAAQRAGLGEAERAQPRVPAGGGPGERGLPGAPAVAAGGRRDAELRLLRALLEPDLHYAGERVAVAHVERARGHVHLGDRARVHLAGGGLARDQVLVRDAVHHEHGLVGAAAADVDLLGV